jgi:hypothetical protein
MSKPDPTAPADDVGGGGLYCSGGVGKGEGSTRTEPRDYQLSLLYYAVM